MTVADSFKQVHTWLCRIKWEVLERVMWTRQLSGKSFRTGICVVSDFPSSADSWGRETGRGFSAFSFSSYQNSPENRVFVSVFISRFSHFQLSLDIINFIFLPEKLLGIFNCTELSRLKTNRVPR